MAPRRKRSEPRVLASGGPRVYRPALSHNVLVAVAAAVFLGLGVGCFVMGEPNSEFLGYPLVAIGTFLVAVGAARFRTRVTVTTEGLRRTPWFPMGFAFTWDEVQYWRVMRIDHVRWDKPGVIAAHFVLAAGKRPIQVSQEDVNRPGFETFLRDIRRFVGGRER
jgi:hypothetical protein